MPAQSPIDLAHLIQLSVAPVFLLTGAGTLLNVLGTRLGRVVDRARVLNERIKQAPGDAQAPLRVEFELLLRRRRLVNLAIASTTAASLVICLLIALMFVGFLLDLHSAWLIAVLFPLAMVGFIAGLVLFLRETLLASASVHLDAR
jgi:hypothetical protein